MMSRFYFEIAGLAQDKTGNNLPAYMRFAVDGYCDAEIARAYAAEKLHIPEDRIKEISEEEYLRNVGVENGGEE